MPILFRQTDNIVFQSATSEYHKHLKLPDVQIDLICLVSPTIWLSWLSGDIKFDDIPLEWKANPEKCSIWRMSIISEIDISIYEVQCFASVGCFVGRLQSLTTNNIQSVHDACTSLLQVTSWIFIVVMTTTAFGLMFHHKIGMSYHVPLECGIFEVKFPIDYLG